MRTLRRTRRGHSNREELGRRVDNPPPLLSSFRLRLYDELQTEEARESRERFVKAYARVKDDRTLETYKEVQDRVFNTLGGSNE